jgi:hypothetical protein
MHLQRLLNTETGRVFISILLGLGLATLFRKVCNDKNCITFNGPIISEVDGKIFKHGEGCYQYSMTPTKCDNTKQIVDITDPPKEGEKIPSPIMGQVQPSNMSPPSTTASSVFSKWFA